MCLFSGFFSEKAMAYSHATFNEWLKANVKTLTISLFSLIIALLFLLAWEVITWAVNKRRLEMETLSEVHIVGREESIAPDEDPFKKKMLEITKSPPPEEAFASSPSVPYTPSITTVPPSAPETSILEPQPVPDIEKPLPISIRKTEPPPPPPPPVSRKERKPITLDISADEEDPWKTLLKSGKSQEEESSPEASAVQEKPATKEVAPSFDEQSMEKEKVQPDLTIPKLKISLDRVPDKAKETGKPKKMRSVEFKEKPISKKVIELEKSLKNLQTSKPENNKKEGNE